MIAERGRDSEKIQRVGNSQTVGGDVLGVRNFLGCCGGSDRLGGAEMTEVLTYEALKAERDALADRVNALAVENAELKSDRDTLAKYWIEDGGGEECAKSYCEETPATDAALAAIQEQGVDKAAAALDALSAQSASATTQANFRAAAVYLRSEVLPAIGEAK